jgi:hypothetical protein
MRLNHSITAILPCDGRGIRSVQAQIEVREEVGEGEVGLHPSDATSQNISKSSSTL